MKPPDVRSEKCAQIADMSSQNEKLTQLTESH